MSGINTAPQNPSGQVFPPAGDLSMGSHKITSLAAPGADADAATKKYVDDNAGGGAPSFVGACIRKKEDTQTISDNTLTKITYDTVVYDTGSIADTANDRLIAPQDGYYRVSFCCTSGGPYSNCSLMKLIKKNGTTIIGTEQRVSVPNYYTTATASITAYLLENDYVELFAQHYGGSYSIVTEDSWQIGANFLQIELVGV